METSNFTDASTAVICTLVTVNRTYDFHKWPLGDGMPTGGGSRNCSYGLVLADMDATETAYVQINVIGESTRRIDVETAGTYFSGWLVA